VAGHNSRVFNRSSWLHRPLQKSQFALFLGGSVLCAGINNVILIAGEWLGYNYVLLTFLCYFVSGSVGYFYHCRITFDKPISWMSYVGFISSLFLGLPLSILLLAIAIEWLVLPMWIAAPAMTMIMFIYHFAIAQLTIKFGLRRSER